jgi:hypothetical protein
MEIDEYLDKGRSGTTGIVYHAKDELGREVAVKFFNQPIGPVRDHVRCHAAALIPVKHENVVQIFGIADLVRPGTEGVSEPSLIMEYVPGQSFADWLVKEPRPTRTEARSVIFGLINGLAALHQLNLAHGDLHGGNVRVNNGACKIIDPIAHDPNFALTTTEAIEKKRRDISAIRLLIIDALKAANADTQAFGEFCMLRTEITSLQELQAHVDLALRTSVELPVSAIPMPITNFYDYCRHAQRSESDVPWQEIQKTAARSVQPALNAWRANKHRLPEKFEDVENELHKLLESISDYVAFIIAAAESRKDIHFQSLRLIRMLPRLEWAKGGETSFVSIPHGLVFCVNYWIGATLVANQNFRAVFDMAHFKLSPRYIEHLEPLWSERKWTGWPEMFGGNSRIAFQFLYRAFSRMPVLRQVFTDESSYRSAIGAYNWLLACVDLVN